MHWKGSMTGFVRPLLLIPAVVAAVAVGAQSPSRPTPAGDALLNGFPALLPHRPPRVWWHRLSGTVSRAYDTVATQADLRFAHRRISDGGIDIVTNYGARDVTTSIAFRPRGRTPEL